MTITTEKHPSITIHTGDCVEAMKAMTEKSLHTCVTSPPYFGLRDYGMAGQLGMEETPDEYVASMVAVFREVRRVLRDDGTLWLNLGDSYAANRSYQVPSTKGGAKHGPGQAAGGKGSKVPTGLKPKDLIGIPWRVALALQADGWYLRQDIIWHKPNVMPESVTDRCTKAHEYIFLLSKQEKYAFDSKAIMEDAKTNASYKHWKDREHDQSMLANKQANGVKGRPKGVAGYSAPGKRNKRSVWEVNTQAYKGAHFAVYPPELIKPCILAGSPEGGVVLDPFFGSGTTAQVARDASRECVGIELNPAYVEIARKRLGLTAPSAAVAASSMAVSP